MITVQRPPGAPRTREQKAADLHLPLDMILPAGKTCDNCLHAKRCVNLFGCNLSNDYCDWSPARFVPRIADAIGH